jgi:hypothetical protein
MRALLMCGRAPWLSGRVLHARFNVVLPLIEYHFFNETPTTASNANQVFARDFAGTMDLYPQGSPVLRADPVLNATVLYLANAIVSPKPDESTFSLLKSQSGSGPRALRAKTIIAFVNPNMNSTANALGQQDGGVCFARLLVLGIIHDVRSSQVSSAFCQPTAPPRKR